MTSFNEPWSIRQSGSGFNATLRDSSGTVVAVFNDYRQAERVLELHAIIASLTDDVEALTKTNDKQAIEIEELEYDKNDLIEKLQRYEKDDSNIASSS